MKASTGPLQTKRPITAPTTTHHGFLKLMPTGASSQSGTFIFTYATTVLGAPCNFVLMAVLTQAVLGFLWVPIAGHLSDRTGRKRMCSIRRYGP